MLKSPLDNEINHLERVFIRLLQREIFNQIIAYQNYNDFKAIVALTPPKQALLIQLFSNIEKIVLGKDLGKMLLAKKFSKELREQDHVDFFRKLMLFNDTDPNANAEENKEKFKRHLARYIRNYVAQEKDRSSVMFEELNTLDLKCVKFIWGAARVIYQEGQNPQYETFNITFKETFREIIAVFQLVDSPEIIEFTRKTLAAYLKDDTKDDKSAGRTTRSVQDSKPTDKLGETIAYLFEMGNNMRTSSSSSPGSQSANQTTDQTQDQKPEPSQLVQALPSSPLKVGASGPAGISFGA